MTRGAWRVLHVASMPLFAISLALRLPWFAVRLPMELGRKLAGVTTYCRMRAAGWRKICGFWTKGRRFATDGEVGNHRKAVRP
jgi:hypothetical protein